MMGFFDHFVTSCSRLHHLGAINFLKSAAGTIKPNVLKCKMLFRFEGEKDQNSINQLVIIAKTHTQIYTFTCTADHCWSWSGWFLILLVLGSALGSPHLLTVSLVLVHGHPANTTESALTIFRLEAGGHRKLQKMILLNGKIVSWLWATVLRSQGSHTSFAGNCWHQGQVILAMVVLSDQSEDIIIDVHQIFLLSDADSTQMTHPVLMSFPNFWHYLKVCFWKEEFIYFINRHFLFIFTWLFRKLKWFAKEI